MIVANKLPNLRAQPEDKGCLFGNHQDYCVLTCLPGAHDSIDQSVVTYSSSLVTKQKKLRYCFQLYAKVCESEAQTSQLLCLSHPAINDTPQQ